MFHAVSFGEDFCSDTLRRMADIAREIQKNAATTEAATKLESSFLQALDTVRPSPPRAVEYTEVWMIDSTYRRIPAFF